MRVTRYRLGLAAAGCVLAAVFAIVIAGVHVTPRSISAQNRTEAPPDGVVATRSLPPDTYVPPPDVKTGHNSGSLELLVTAAAALFGLTAVGAIIYLLTAGLRDLPRRRSRRADPRPGRRLPQPPPMPTVLSRAVDEGLDALNRETTSSDAIIAAWLALRDAAAADGVTARATDTPEEFTARVLGRWAVDRAALDELAALYREARYSAHELGPPERARARAALARVHDGLVTGTSRGGAHR